MNVLERIVDLDFRLFYKVNGVWTNHFFDNFFPYIRESIIWLPLYLFLLLFGCINFGLKGVYWCVAFLCMASVCDILSSHVIKEQIYRSRPCKTASLMGSMRMLAVYCPQSSGFVSSHAANHFGAAMFIYVTWKKLFPGWNKVFFFWAAAIAYAQVYVGVHFPLDVLCGALLGVAVGLLGGTSFNRYIGLSRQTA